MLALFFLLFFKIKSVYSYFRFFPSLYNLQLWYMTLEKIQLSGNLNEIYIFLSYKFQFQFKKISFKYLFFDIYFHANFFWPCLLSMSGTSPSMSRLPWKSGILLFALDHALILKVGIITMGSSGPLDGMDRIVLALKLVHKFQVVTHLACMIPWSLLSQ
jgi:hypothetical protein